MLIVNITTTSKRLQLCSATVLSLTQQSLLPEKIIVWISKEPYLSDEGILEVPQWIKNINELLKINDNSFHDLIEFRYTENTGPYRKIVPILREINSSSLNDTIVYADDDVIYGIDWLKKMVKLFNDNQGLYVVAPRVRVIKKNIFNVNKSYNLFPISTRSEIIGTDFIITGVGGCVLSRKHIDTNFLLLNDFLDIAPTTDDIWISKIIELSGSKVLTCPSALIDVQEISHCNDALNLINTLQNNRKKYFNILLKILVRVKSYFGVSLSTNDANLKKVNIFFDK